MPSRKSGSSESHPDSGPRSSLRRLSSIASLQSLFTRRRSNTNNHAHSTDAANDQTTASSSSNLSLSSNIIPEAEEPYQVASSHRNLHNVASKSDPLPPMPAYNSSPACNASYVCAPDDPLGGMPRSRTFTNLPLPARAKKFTHIASSKSHNRLPVGPTRLPSPPVSNRKHSRLQSNASKLPIPNRMQRSDTEPLLKVEGVKSGNFGRSTAFKENISLSPIKPLPAMDMFRHGSHREPNGPSQPQHAGTPYWRDSSSGTSNTTVSDHFPSSPPPIATMSHHPAIQLARPYKSSPTCHASKLRHASPSTTPRPSPAQRWMSQPALTDVTNTRRQSQHEEIVQKRLMSARQAPTPPPSQPTLSNSGLAPSGKRPTTSPPTTPWPSHHVHTTPPTTTKPHTHHHHIPELSPYWAGRISALTDRYRNEELATHLSTLTSSVKLAPEALHTPEAAVARLRRALLELHGTCVTRAARESLVAFQEEFVEVVGREELREVGGGGGGGVAVKAKAEALLVGGKRSEVRKASFVERLLGRPAKRRSLLVA